MATIEKVSKVKAHTRYKNQNGAQVPGVTTIIGMLSKGNALVKWANNLGLEGIDSNKFVDALADIGTLAHYMAECHIKQEKPDLTAYSPESIDLAENSFISFLEWEKQYQIEYLECELSLVSESFQFGGQCDVYCIINGKRNLVDLKTSKAIYPEMLIQLAAYKRLLEENGYPVDEVRILRIGRTETEGFEERKETDLRNHWEMFKHLRAVYDLNKLINKRR